MGPSNLRLQGEDVQLKVLYSDLVLGAKIGYGACSSVYVATHKRSGAKYAIKMFSVYDQRQADQLKKEIVMLSKLDQCDALLSMEGVFHQEVRGLMLIWRLHPNQYPVLTATYIHVLARSNHLCLFPSRLLAGLCWRDPRIHE